MDRKTDKAAYRPALTHLNSGSLPNLKFTRGLHLTYSFHIAIIHRTALPLHHMRSLPLPLWLRTTKNRSTVCLFACYALFACSLAHSLPSSRESEWSNGYFCSVFRCAIASLYEVVSVRRSVRPSVRRSVGPSHFTFIAFLGYLEVEKFRYEYFMDINAPAQFITAPAQPPATGAVMYTALFIPRLVFFYCFFFLYFFLSFYGLFFSSFSFFKGLFRGGQRT